MAIDKVKIDDTSNVKIYKWGESCLAQPDK